MKKFLGVILLSSLLFSIFGCSSNKEDNSSASLKDDSTKKVGYQLNAPEQDEEIAVIKTNMGDIKLRFFPEAAPKAVENFKTHSKQGYYNGVIFHRVINDFMIQGGDPQGTGTGGESIWGTAFNDEFSDKLFNIRGSVAMANSGKNTNGSQFFINQATAKSFPGWDSFQQSYDLYKSNPDLFTQTYGGTVDMSKVNDEIKKLYQENGGNPHLDGALNTNGTGHTVFAQVFEGMDVVDKIAGAKADNADKPLKDIVMESVQIVKYSK